MIWHLFWLVVIGGGAGILAKLILAGLDRAPSPVVAGTLGIFGAFGANYLTQRLSWWTQTNGLSLVAAIVGALVLVILYCLARRILNASNR